MRTQSGFVQFVTTDLNSGAAINIGGVTQLGVSTGTETLSDESGDIYDETRSIVKQNPTASWSTKAISTMLSTVGLAGYCILSDGSHAGVRLYCKALGDCKSPPGATDGARYTFPYGLVVLNQLTARRGQDAQLSCQLYGITDGTNAPISGIYTGLAFPAVSAILKQQLVLGRCKVGGIVLPDLDEVTIRFGCQMTRYTPEMGGIWPDSIAVRKVQPTITFRSFDPTILADVKIALAGIQGAHANTLIQLKKRVNYSTFELNASTVHTAFTANGIVTVPDAISASGNAESTTMAVMNCIHDGTTVPITYSVATTYNPSP